MTSLSTVLSFSPVESRNGRVALLLATCLVLLGVARAEAATITWHWTGPVTGYTCALGSCGPITIDSVVPLGTPVDVFVSFAPDFPTYPNPALPCLAGSASLSLQVVGRTYTAPSSFVFVDAAGFAGWDARERPGVGGWWRAGGESGGEPGLRAGLQSVEHDFRPPLF